ncbi:hypothetical protein LNQ81_03145 [Myroides sp. M-43]|uniref:hypothetical protein n=1 Tax=Myroides oncorhynchi TaxID=2893756 RepID=UPI001E56CF4F|nr:hypothetical protein [Myroides oncorhynchi]MCC9041700.1 hypothetical protein [Myroides oncorhynchi]
MSIECIMHIEKSCQLKQELANEQQQKGNNDLAINYYIEAISRLEVLCTSYKAYLKTGPILYLQYIDISIKLITLYRKEQETDKYKKLVFKLNAYIDNVKELINKDHEMSITLANFKLKLDNI